MTGIATSIANTSTASARVIALSAVLHFTLQFTCTPSMESQATPRSITGSFRLPPVMRVMGRLIMADRDPRFQPKPGDILTNGAHTFYVTRVEGEEVFYTEDQPPVPELSSTIEDWCAYSKNDTVVARSEVKA